MRRIWLRQNEVLYGGPFAHPEVLIQAAKDATVVFQAAQVPISLVGAAKSSTRGRATLEGWVMANWDAAIDKKHGRWGLRVILRDHTGRMIAAKCSTRVGCLDPGAAEVVAALDAVLLCRKVDMDRIIFMGDAKMVVEAVLAQEPDWSTKGHIIEEIMEQIRSFHNWRMIHVPREKNQIAHVLARLGSTQGIENEWSFEPPNCISELLVTEQCVSVI